MIGCSHPSRVSRTSQTQGNPMVPRTTLVADTPVEPAPTTQAPTSAVHEESATPPATVATPDVPAAVVKSIGRSSEPVAEGLVNAMLGSIQDRRTGDDGITRIGLAQVRNQSRTSREEFDAFDARLAEILTQASRDPKVVFVPGDSQVMQYHVQGTAYLVTFEGFDLWELYLSLSPADKNMTMWSASGPVYVMRLPRPGQPQMVVKAVK